MPKLKEPESQKVLRRLRANIRYGMELYGINVHALAIKMRCCTATAYNRLQDPSQITIGELYAIARALHTTADALLQEKSA